MNRRIKRALELIISIGGSLLALYVGGYLLFLHSILVLYSAFTAGTLTGKLLLFEIVKIAVASTVGGALWCLFDIIAGHFRDRGDEEN